MHSVNIIRKLDIWKFILNYFAIQGHTSPHRLWDSALPGSSDYARTIQNATWTRPWLVATSGHLWSAAASSLGGLWQKKWQICWNKGSNAHITIARSTPTKPEYTRLIIGLWGRTCPQSMRVIAGGKTTHPELLITLPKNGKMVFHMSPFRIIFTL